MNRVPRPRVSKKTIPTAYSRPFWLAAANYYTFSAAITIFVFFLTWGLMHDANEQAPWIGAGLLAGIVLAGAVLLREVILRIYRNKFLAARARLDQSLHAAVVLRAGDDRKKITLEQNKAWLKYIATKSEAAKVLGKIADAHREVFDLCDGYLKDIALELPHVAPGSPRIAAFVSGRKRILSLHKYHLLRWAELESKQIVSRSEFRGNMNDRLTAASRAESALSFALGHYPDDLDLLASHAVVENVLRMAKAAELAAGGETARERGNLEDALRLYQDALQQISEGGGTNTDTENIVRNISGQIEAIVKQLKHN